MLSFVIINHHLFIRELYQCLWMLGQASSTTQLVPSGPGAGLVEGLLPHSPLQSLL